MKLLDILEGDVVDIRKHQNKDLLGNAINSATQWPERALPMNPEIKKQQGIFLTAWIHSTEENLYTLGPFKSVKQAVQAAKDQMEPEELEDAEDTPDFFELREIPLRRPRSKQQLSALEFGADEGIFVITKDFVPTVDMIFSHGPTRAGSPSQEIRELQDQIAEIEGLIQSGQDLPFYQKRYSELIQKLNSKLMER